MFRFFTSSMMKSTRQKAFFVLRLWFSYTPLSQNPFLHLSTFIFSLVGSHGIPHTPPPPPPLLSFSFYLLSTSRPPAPGPGTPAGDPWASSSDQCSPVCSPSCSSGCAVAPRRAPGPLWSNTQTGGMMGRHYLHNTTVTPRGSTLRYLLLTLQNKTHNLTTGNYLWHLLSSICVFVLLNTGKAIPNRKTATPPNTETRR